MLLGIHFNYVRKGGSRNNRTYRNDQIYAVSDTNQVIYCDHGVIYLL